MAIVTKYNGKIPYWLKKKINLYIVRESNNTDFYTGNINIGRIFVILKSIH